MMIVKNISKLSVSPLVQVYILKLRGFFEGPSVRKLSFAGSKLLTNVSLRQILKVSIINFRYWKK